MLNINVIYFKTKQFNHGNELIKCACFFNHTVYIKITCFDIRGEVKNNKCYLTQGIV